ncbi:DUF397 domain-containing protein [Streptomyces sp. NPDC002812]|uniref:DUF397 domain-containing protein n=1 Tax=Streptomyces sp. NPDC002812 TaxID=3154434 RepID=UPI00332EF89C
MHHYDGSRRTSGAGPRVHCVEVATCAHAIHIRDSKVTAGPQPAIAPGAWAAFLGGVTEA